MIPFEDGTVLLDPEEIQQLDKFSDKVGRLMDQFAVLTHQHEQLKSIHNYVLLCRDNFEAENIRLRRQIKADQYAAYNRILTEDRNFRAGL